MYIASQPFPFYIPSSTPSSPRRVANFLCINLSFFSITLSLSLYSLSRFFTCSDHLTRRQRLVCPLVPHVFYASNQTEGEIRRVDGVKGQNYNILSPSFPLLHWFYFLFMVALGFKKILSLWVDALYFYPSKRNDFFHSFIIALQLHPYHFSLG